MNDTTKGWEDVGLGSGHTLTQFSIWLVQKANLRPLVFSSGGGFHCRHGFIASVHSTSRS